MTFSEGGLPADRTSLIGRWQDSAAVMGLLTASRLVTLTGVGGVGKTRLALRAARLARRRYPDGVWYAELAALRDPRLLAHTLSTALRLAQQDTRPQAEVLADHLRGRELLLILDTCEHLVDACAELAGTLLRAASRLTILATSRTALGVTGERCYGVEPLPETHAVRLFTERAADLVPGFEPTAEVEQLCEMLDGIPLAIELAAVRMRTLTPAELVERLDDRFHLLQRGAGSPARHQTMRTTIGWSHELCEPEERLLWARLSVFGGDFDLDGARAVCADRSLPAHRVEGLLGSLVDKSLVRPAAEGRFTQLDTVREYGAEWLRRLDEQHALRRRHRDHYLGLARRFDAEWFGPDQIAWCHRMRGELPNLRAALDLCFTDPAEHRIGLDLVGRLGFLWQACGFLAEGRHHLARALSLCPEPSPERRRALWLGSWTANFQGDLDDADDLATECLVGAVAERDHVSAGWSAACCGITGIYSGRLAEALALFERAQEFHECGGDDGIGLAYTFVVQAYLHTQLGRHEEAWKLLERQRALCHAHGELWTDAYGEWVRGLVELARGNPASADFHTRASLRVKFALHDCVGMAACLASLSGTAAGMGDHSRAAKLLGIVSLVQHRYGLRLTMSRLAAIRRDAERDARQVLGERRYDDAYRAGYTSPLPAALDYAIDGTSGVSHS
ncbi:ATPase [Nonomuraea sp. NBC_01738]|uniref:ATP-binding protein n=1 Tax=Nonomuraea sp. NBC_01738 TaxID=2976003 RepID=UPI002E116573|nr:ATPase [Nonomuraea sp. NBC_01738]